MSLIEHSGEVRIFVIVDALQDDGRLAGRDDKDAAFLSFQHMLKFMRRSKALYA